jgi:Na+-transporting NADH:ubiquinone oxidoreductase subunit C
MQNNSVTKTVVVAFTMCIVCSALVAGAAIGLRDLQVANQSLDTKKSLLLSSGMLKNTKASAEEVLEMYSKIDVKLVDFETGDYVEGIEPETFSEAKAAKTSDLGLFIPANEDIAKIKIRSKYGKVYLAKNDAGELDMIILPVHGKGLWSTMYGFLALDKDATTVRGFGYYSHGETPGLGGEVDNPNWKAQWPGKKVFDEAGKPVIRLIKGKVQDTDPEALYKIDGLSGSTITADGVSHTVQYWIGDHGYGRYLEKYKNSQAISEEEVTH